MSFKLGFEVKAGDELSAAFGKKEAAILFPIFPLYCLQALVMGPSENLLRNFRSALDLGIRSVCFLGIWFGPRLPMKSEKNTPCGNRTGGFANATWTAIASNMSNRCFRLKREN